MRTISPKSLALLRELEHVPQGVGYNHEIAELDAARLIRWEHGFGYIASEDGRELLKRESQ